MPFLPTGRIMAERTEARSRNTHGGETLPGVRSEAEVKMLRFFSTKSPSRKERQIVWLFVVNRMRCIKVIPVFSLPLRLGDFA